MFPYPILSDNSEAQHFLFPFRSLQRDDHSCWNFFFDHLRASDLVLSKKLAVFLVICCSDFFFQERSSFLLILREDQLIFDLILDMIRFAGCFGIMLDFFKQPQASVQIDTVLSFELFGSFWFLRQILFTSVPLHYFELKSVWLPFITFDLGSPPEDLLFRYLLFVTIR